MCTVCHRLCPDGMYSYPVDMWSCGCILAEMLGRCPLFPGKTFIHQLSLVFDVIGSPPEQDVRHIVNAEARSFLQSQQGKRKTAFSSLYPTAESNSWKLLDQLLQFNPAKRITADEALQSPYLHGVGTAASLVFPPTSPDFVFTFESADLTRSQLRQLICDEIASFRREKFPRPDRAGSALRSKKSSASKSSSGVMNEDLFDTDDRSSAAGAKEDDDSSLQKHSHILSQNPNLGNSTRRNSSSLRREDKRELSPPAPPVQPVEEAPAKGYMRGTKNFKTRAASAPRPRPSDAQADNRNPVQQRREGIIAENDDGASIPHQKDGKSLRLDPAIQHGTVGIANMYVGSVREPVKPDGGSSPQASKQKKPSLYGSEAKQESSEMSQSTIRNMLNMCDELYYGTPANPSVSAAVDKTDKVHIMHDDKDSEYASHPALLRRSRAHSYEHDADSKFTSDVPTADRTASMRDSKEVWSSALYHTTQSDGMGLSSPARNMRAPVAAVRKEDVGDSEAKAEPHGKSGMRSSYDFKMEHSDDVVPAEPKRYTTQNPSTSTLRSSMGTVHNDRFLTTSAGSEFDSDGEEPVPRSPPRKSLLATYTSPKRLGAGKNTSEVGSPGGSPVRPFTPREHASNSAAGVPVGLLPTGNSLVDKLLERAQRLSMAYEVPPPTGPRASRLQNAGEIKAHGIHAGAGQTHAGASRANAIAAAEADEDSSVGSNVQIYPENDRLLREEVLPAAGKRGTSDGIAAQERRTAAPERQAPPIIPPPPDKKKFTVGKSPKFSQMSWQRRLNEQREAQEKLLREQEEEEHKRKTKAAKTSSGNYFGYQAPKRSDSAPRARR